MSDLGAREGGISAGLADFYTEMRRFAAFYEDEAGGAGLTVQQFQALLVVAGHEGEGPPGIGAIAERLLLAPHSAAELVARMVRAKLLTKVMAAADRRRSELRLTPRAARLLHELAALHLEELKLRVPWLLQAVAKLRAVSA